MTGRFLTPPGCTVRHHTDGTGLATLLSPIRYQDSHGRFWTAPWGTVGDGASIPRFLWAIFGHPWQSDHQRAGWLHDKAYQEAEPCSIWQAMFCDERAAVDAMFYEAIWVDVSENGWTTPTCLPKWRIFSRLVRAVLLHLAKNEEAYAIFLGVRLGGWWAWWKHGREKSKQRSQANE